MCLLTRNQKYILICGYEFRGASDFSGPVNIDTSWSSSNRGFYGTVIRTLITVGVTSENQRINDYNSALFIQRLLQSRLYRSPKPDHQTLGSGKLTEDKGWIFPQENNGRSLVFHPFCKLLVVGVPQIGGGNSNNAAGEPPSRVSVQKAPGVSALAQVISLFVDHHCSSDRRHPSKERRIWFYHRVDLSFLQLKVTEVSRMVGVVFTIWVVVPTGGDASLAQVSVLMDVDGCGLTVSEKATKLKEDGESSLRVLLLEQHVTVQFGQILWQRGAGSHVAGRVQAAIVLRGLRWS